jgi:acetyl-CoA acetyltransferase
MKCCRSFAAVGVDPAVMGVGPAFAIPAAVKSAGLELSNIDLFEINEVKFISFHDNRVTFYCTFSKHLTI